MHPYKMLWSGSLCRTGAKRRNRLCPSFSTQFVGCELPRTPRLRLYEKWSLGVFRYSSTHEKALPDGPFRRRMEIHRTPPARLQGIRTAQDPQPSRDPERHLLPLEERLPVAPAAS